MTRKDYQLIADAIRAVYRTQGEFGWNDSTLDRQDAIRQVANSLVCRLVEDNPRFDEDRFREACGL